VHAATTEVLQLRLATAADTDALLTHRSPQSFRERVPEMLATTTVAPADERVVGLMVTAADEVEPLHVAARHRGTGVAGALLQHGERVIAGEHCRAFLAVVDGNARARRFSTCHGWDDAGSFDHRAWSSTGERVAVPCRRYEKACPAPLAGMRRQAVVAERESDDRCGREP
jgi:GNAT superfamily N-acetyltransferase